MPISKINISNTYHQVVGSPRYAICDTAASTVAKVAALGDNSSTFTLENGVRICVKFTYANSVASPTLNVASTGAKAIYWHGAAITSSQYWQAGAVLDFVYNGTQWELVGVANDNNKTYSAATTSVAGLMSAADKTKLDGIATGATKVTVDSALNSSSTNPVQNKVINTEIDGLKTLVGDTAVATQISNYAAPKSHTHPYAASSTPGGVATSAKKISVARTIDGVSFDGSDNITHYGTCYTDAATIIKVVNLVNFVLTTGAKVAVKFTITNTAAKPTLNVNGTGAKAIYYRGSPISAKYLAANRVYEFVYDGTNYELIGDIDSNTTYSVATTSINGLMSYGDKSKLNGIASGAEVNQNAFSNVVVGSTTIAADSKTDTLTLAAGTNITLTPDATNDKVTIALDRPIYAQNSEPANAPDGTMWIDLDEEATGSSVDADTLDGRQASYFATASDVSSLQALVGGTSVESQINQKLSSRTLIKHLQEEQIVLTSLQYGNTLPTAGIPGRLFFKKVSS